MNTNKMKELFSDQAFVKKLTEMETAAQVQAELKKKGLDLSENDVVKIKEEINKHLKSGKKAEELSLEALDDVAGGSSILSIAPSHLIQTMQLIKNPDLTTVRW